MSSDHHVHVTDLSGDLFVHFKSGMTESDDLVNAQSGEFVYLMLQDSDLLLKTQVRPWGHKEQNNPQKTWTKPRYSVTFVFIINDILFVILIFKLKF